MTVTRIFESQCTPPHWNLEGFKQNDKADFRTFTVFLKKICIGDASDDILDQCLMAALPICNAQETKILLRDW